MGKGRSARTARSLKLIAPSPLSYAASRASTLDVTLRPSPRVLPTPGAYARRGGPADAVSRARSAGVTSIETSAASALAIARPGVGEEVLVDRTGDQAVCLCPGEAEPPPHGVNAVRREPPQLVGVFHERGV